jgi:folate-binding Fe-S cluster repair protein YgfZ
MLNDTTFEQLNAGGFAAILPERTVLRIQGKDTLTFLQGMTTNDVLSFQSADDSPTAIFTMFLNAPGRVLTDTILVPEHVGDESQSLLIDCHRDVADILRKHLKRFKLRSKFSLEDVSGR